MYLQLLPINWKTILIENVYLNQAIVKCYTIIEIEQGFLKII